VRVRVCMPDHVHARIQERGGDPASVAAAARRAARAVLPRLHRPHKVAVETERLPVVAVVQILPGKKPPRAVVKTVLPPTAPSLRRMEVVYV